MLQSRGRTPRVRVFRGVFALIVFAAAFGVGFLLTTSVAEAMTWQHIYPFNHWTQDWNDNCVSSQTVRWRFSNDSTQQPLASSTTYAWTSSQQTQVDAASNRWDAVKTQTGGRYSDVASTTSTAATVFKVIHRDVSATGYGGVVLCDGSQAVMYLDFTKDAAGTLLTNDSMQGIAAHEFGHTLSLMHVGVVDNLYNSSKIPTMATLLPVGRYPSELKWLEADDWANLATATGLGRPLGGNPSFEQGHREGWKLQSGASWTLYSSGSPRGSYHVRVLGYGKYILNESRVWGLPDDKDLQAVVWNRDMGSFASGKIRIGLWVRQVEASGTHDTYCAIPGCPHLNHAVVHGTWTQVRSADVWPTSSWDDDYTSWYDVDDSWEGVDVYVRIWNYMKGTDGNSTRMYIDDAYVRAL